MKQTFAAALWLSASAAAVAPAPATWRLDYYHTGGPRLEVFSVDKIVVEPLPWAGPAGKDIDPAKLGSYRFEIRDPSGEVLFARGYSPIFAEWMTTAEASEGNATFHESLRCPAPSKPVDVVVLKRDANNRFVEAWRTRLDPNNQFIDRSVRPSPPPIRVEYHGDPTSKVDVLLLGDGYTAAECQTKIRRDVRRMANAMFSIEPYKSRRNDFNIWGLCPPSPKSGVSRPSNGIHIANPVGSSYDTFGSERYVLTMDNRAFRTIASAAPYEFATILVNSKTYGGGGLYNIYSTVAVDND